MIKDFSNGKIYKISNDFNNDIYIGSTCDDLKKRFSYHKYDRHKPNKLHLPLYKLMNEIGFERFRIDLIELYPSKDVYDLRHTKRRILD